MLGRRGGGGGVAQVAGSSTLCRQTFVQATPFTNEPPSQGSSSVPNQPLVAYTEELLEKGMLQKKVLVELCTTKPSYTQLHVEATACV